MSSSRGARTVPDALQASLPPFTLGLLGHGTVGSAFAELLAARSQEIERFNGRRPLKRAISSERSVSSSAKAEPTVPCPSRPSVNGGSDAS